MHRLCQVYAGFMLAAERQMLLVQHQIEWCRQTVTDLIQSLPVKSEHTGLGAFYIFELQD